MSWLPLVRIWIWLSVVASAAGWILSALGQLNRGGYLIFFGLAAAVFVALRRFSNQRSHRANWNWSKVRWRFRHGLPGCFAALAFLIFVGGALYAPSTHTALTYRLPRVLQWLAEGKWHWIHTGNFRMNDRACGIEWLTAPLLLFMNSDRALFLLNFIPFLLLPGLTFSVCTRLGVRGRVAWQWMWLLPTGYNFLVQAGSAANDTFPTVYALAAVDFACRSWSTRRVSDFWLSLLSVGLLSGAKASNLPLMLPWGILALALWPLLKRRPVATLAVGVLAALVSFLPTAILNNHYCHDWSGLNLENAGMDMKNPIVGVWGNSLLFLLDNYVPPFFPAAGWWNQSALSILPQAMVAPMAANFEEGFHRLGEMPTEDWVGLGLGVSLLMAVAAIGGVAVRPVRRVGRVGQDGELPKTLRRLVLVAPWLALLAYCTKSGMVSGARLISPYYPLLLPWLIAGAGQSAIIRTRWWRALVWLVLCVAFPVIMLTPGRPLWPARTVLSRLANMKPESRSIARAREVYTVYAERPDPMARVRELLPNGLAVVGFLGTPDDIDMSFWRPLGQKQVKHLLPNDSAAAIRQRGVQYAVVSQFCLGAAGITLEAWRQRTGAELLASARITQKIAEGPQTWHVVRFP